MKKRLLVALLAFVAASGAFAKDEKRFNECRNKLKKLHEVDVLYDLSWNVPQDPRVVVGQTFYRVSYDAKQNFATTVNCFLMAGDSGKYVNFELIDWRTGNAVGRYAYGKLQMN
jgi:hypothetical protein